MSYVFRKRLWHFYEDSSATLYLTFDDGPTPGVTDKVLDILKEYDAKATFFCIGKNIQNYPILFKRIIDEGHCVGNHTYYHENGSKTTKESYLESILQTDIFLPKGNQLFRPPYGRVSQSQVKALLKLGKVIVMWDVLSGDFDTNIGPKRCYINVVNSATKGSIIVYHDSLKAERNLLGSLPAVLKYYTEKGYFFHAIPSIFKA